MLTKFKFTDLCCKVRDYLETCDSVLSFKVPCKGTDGVFRANVHLDVYTFELELHNDNEKRLCSVFHLTKDYETVVPCNTNIELTYSEALALVRHACENDGDLVKKLLRVSW